MPWELSDDLDKYKAEMTTAQKRQWVSTANAVMKRCTGEGKDVKECDAMAIRIANGAVEEAGLVAVDEAATIKAQAQGLLRAAKLLLGNKALPESLHRHIDTLRAELRKHWSEIEGEDAEDEEPEGKPAPKAEPATAAAEAQDAVAESALMELTETVNLGALLTLDEAGS